MQISWCCPGACQESRVQCLGQCRDEALINEVARVLLEDLRKKPLLSSRQVRRRLNSGAAATSSYALGARRERAAAAIRDTGDAS